jgi:hypothetical protein
MSHVVTVPDYIWEWAQRETQLKKPTTFLRNTLSQAMIDYIQREDSSPAEPKVDNLTIRWTKLGCSLDSFDERFTIARKSWVEAHDNEKAAVEWLEKAVRERNMQNPRAFVIAWYKQNGN